ncbi:hypothetical protein V1477_004686 [Vespula maculifrons]|uniref:Uncharacterized protein n=1 Tax=Vespula maculifrons TaxID=7453 RepID=A0ABD2CMK8_VESMC
MKEEGKERSNNCASMMRSNSTEAIVTVQTDCVRNKDQAMIIYRKTDVRRLRKQLESERISLSMRSDRQRSNNKL